MNTGNTHVDVRDRRTTITMMTITTAPATTAPTMISVMLSIPVPPEPLVVLVVGLSVVVDVLAVLSLSPELGSTVGI